MKKRDLERLLESLGWYFKRHGAKHDLWTDGEYEEAVPRHKEINELLARKILKTAKKAFEGKNNGN